MSTRLINLTTILVASIACGVFTRAAVAEVPVNAPQTISNFNDASVNSTATSSMFENVFTNTAGDFYLDTSIEGQLDSWFNSYPENEISEAGEKINSLYNQLMKQQVGNDPVMRTRDLANPFNTSVMENPEYLGGN